MEGIILSSWDHIVGPQIEKLWLMNISGKNRLLDVSDNILRDINSKDSNIALNTTFGEMKVYCIMCGQLLLGEVDSYKSFTKWSSRLYVSEYKIICGVIFHQKHWLGLNNRLENEDKDACLCIGVIFKRDALNFVLNDQAVIDLHLRKCINKLQNLKISCVSHLKNFHSIIEDTAAIINSLDESKSYLEYKIQPLVHDFINSDIISKAIVSHLQTYDCTVVISSSEFTLKKVISVLALLNIQKESFCPITSFNHVSNTFIEGIYMQGIVKNSKKNVEQLLEQAIRDSQSLTVVDIDMGKVWQTVTVKDVNGCYRTSARIVEEIGLLIPQLLNDLTFIQETGRDARPFVQNFCNYIKSKSTSLIKAVQQTRSAGLSLTLNEILMVYGINNITDLKILLGCAEKLKPGFCFTILE